MNYYIYTRNELEVIDLNEVVYMKADGNYTDVYYKSGRVKTILSCLSVFDANIKAMHEKESLSNPYFRMGRSLLINVEYIQSINTQTQHLTFKCDAVKGISSTKSLLRRLCSYMVEFYHIKELKPCNAGGITETSETFEAECD